MILAIDPGTFASAYVRIDEDYRPVEFGKLANEELLDKVRNLCGDELVCEMVESFGMAVGKEVFETVFWIGRFWEAFPGRERSFLYRREEQLRLCGTVKAGDANIRQALVDRFAYGVPNKGKGIKAAPGWFYGFYKDIWQAYAVAVTYVDRKKEGAV